MFRHIGKSGFHGAPFQHVAVPDPVSTLMPQLAKRHYALFWAWLLGGFGGMIALTNATIDIHTRRMEELFIVAGSLFLPLLFVYYLDMRSYFVPPRFRTLLATFIIGAFMAAP